MNLCTSMTITSFVTVQPENRETCRSSPKTSENSPLLQSTKKTQIEWLLIDIKKPRNIKQKPRHASTALMPKTKKDTLSKFPIENKGLIDIPKLQHMYTYTAFAEKRKV